MQNPDRKILDALATLSKSLHGKVLVEYLNTELQHTTDMLIDAPAERVGWLQGKAKTLKELTTLVEDSTSIVERLSR